MKEFLQFFYVIFYACLGLLIGSIIGACINWVFLGTFKFEGFTVRVWIAICGFLAVRTAIDDIIQRKS